MVSLVFFTRIHPSPALLLVSHSQQPLTASFSINPTRLLPHRIRTKNRRWDSNAETFRKRNYDFDSTNSDEDFEDDDDDDDANQWLDILEDFIDGVWIFKAFRSFGWILPALISSFLLTSGPKAFLMALAIPMGQSALSLLFQTVWGRPRSKTRGRGKTKRKPPPPPPRSPRPSRATGYTEDEEDEDVRRERKRAATGYQTWVAEDGGSSDDKTNGSASSFGGWEELDGRSNSYRKRGKPKKPVSKMSRRERRTETPLLLRLLIAVFPFLGSWTRML